jgi:hypothetical protein
MLTTPAGDENAAKTAELRERLRGALGASYALGPELGRGGMGLVLRATDLRLKREVAIKVLPPELSWRSDLRQRLIREAQLAASLSHPNVVPIFDVGEEEELVWLIMAFVEGETLHQRVEREGPQPLSLVRRVLQNTAWALAYAHARGIVHRDVKPDNIMLEAATGRPVVTDFGIAKAPTRDQTRITAPGQMVGTLIYMAPELILEESQPDARSDLYSLGLVGYYLLTGEHAVRGTTIGGIIEQHKSGEVPDPRTVRPQIPDRFVRTLRTALAPAPEDRYASAEAFAEAISRAGPDIPETPAVIQRFFDASRRSFQLATIYGLGIGVVAFKAIPAVFSLLFLGAVLAGWVRRLEAVISAGFGWEAVRRALYAARARYIDERTVRREAALPRSPLSSVTWFVTVAGCALLGAYYLEFRPRQPLLVEGLNQALLIFCAFSGLLVARALGMGPVRPEGVRRASTAMAFRVAAPTCAVVAVMLGVPFGPLWGGGGGFAAAVVSYAWVRYRPRSPSAGAPDAEWQLPLWLDALGSWCFASMSIARGGLRWRRDEPTGARRTRIGGALVRRRQRAIDRALSRLPDAERQEHLDLAALVQQLGEGIEQGRAQLRDVEARLLRLQAGVISTRDDEGRADLQDALERALAEEARLRARMREEWEALRELEEALETRSTRERRVAVTRAVEHARTLTHAPAPQSPSLMPR